MTTDDDMTEDELAAHLDSLDFTCAACGADSLGEAAIGDKFYCHRDERSCYMATSYADASLHDFLGALKSDGWTVTFTDERGKP